MKPDFRPHPPLSQGERVLPTNPPLAKEEGALHPSVSLSEREWMLHTDPPLARDEGALPTSVSLSPWKRAGVRAGVSRRQLLHAGAGLAGWLTIRPAQADQLDEAIRAWTGGALVQTGRVKLDIAPLVDNGNTVPISVSVDSPMTAADHVVAIAVFNQRNPQADVVRFTLGPRAGRASVATRMRLATTQKLSAIARLSDGSYWQHTLEVIVTLAACLEEVE